jgi:hypothetical protein
MHTLQGKGFRRGRHQSSRFFNSARSWTASASSFCNRRSKVFRATGFGLIGLTGFGLGARNPTRSQATHVDSRQTCSGCRTRVFTFADEIDTDGAVLRHLCSRCARIARGEPVCRICGEQIIDTPAGWRHANQQRRHPAAPLIAV